MTFKNPILRQDYPDVDVIRVDDTYYMISTTMHFMPGAVILRSYDLQNWEIASYIYETLDGTKAQCLTGKENIYGKGMWAPSLRYHNGTFYVTFVANDTHKTYLYRSSSIQGPWNKSEIEGFYHDLSLFFDDDDRAYVIYGNTDIRITELNDTLSAPKENGLNRILVTDADHPSLGYEGSHFYKIDGYYYLFLIHSLRDRWFRTEACYSSTSLFETFTGGDVFTDDAGYRNSGIAQGGIVDTPDGDWYAILFQDRGAVGRIPYVIPATLESGHVTIGNNGKMPDCFEVKSTRPGYSYEPLFTSDFLDNTGKLSKPWQWNHEPDLSQITMTRNSLSLHSNMCCHNITEARNSLTQRTYDPYSYSTVTLDFSQIKEGDYAGLSAFQGCYGFIGVTKRGGQNHLVCIEKNDEVACLPLPNDITSIQLRCDISYQNDKDQASFSYQLLADWEKFGPVHPLVFLLDHFVGCRFALFYYSTKEIGGSAHFKDYTFSL